MWVKKVSKRKLDMEEKKTNIAQIDVTEPVVILTVKEYERILKCSSCEDIKNVIMKEAFPIAREVIEHNSKPMDWKQSWQIDDEAREAAKRFTESVLVKLGFTID